MSRVSPTLPLENGSDNEQTPHRQSVCSVLRHAIYWRCLFLTLLIGACLGAVTWCRVTQVTKVTINQRFFNIAQKRMTSPCEDGIFYFYCPVFLILFYILYQVECYMCPVRTLLSESNPASEVAALLCNLRAAQPIIWWKAICYRYVRHSRHTTRFRDGSAFDTSQHQVFYARLNSHTAGSCFLSSSCGVKDVSRKLINISKFPFTKIKFSKGFAFLNLEAAVDFEEQRSRFFQMHERRDDYMEMREGLDLTNVSFKEVLLARRDKGMPWYTHPVVYFFASLLVLSWPLRLFIESNTAHIHYQVTKLFGVNYSIDDTARISRSSVSADSHDLELSIAGNCSLAPSYSEALLMITPPSPGESNLLPSPPPPPCHAPPPLMFYRPAPLPARRPDDPFEGRWCCWSSQAPPGYDEALQVSEPLNGTALSASVSPTLETTVTALGVQLRRSRTERDFKGPASRLLFPRRSCHYAYETHL